MSSIQGRLRVNAVVAAALAVILVAAGCATSGYLRAARKAERAEDFDRAVIEYTKAARARPDDRVVRASLERVKLRAAQEHVIRGRRLADAQRYEEALIEFQVASELNPTDPTLEAAVVETRKRLKTKLAIARGGKTELQSLVERSRHLPPAGFELPDEVKLPDSLVFQNASTRMILTAITRFADLNIVFDPAYRDATMSADLRNVSVTDALDSVTSSTRNFYRVTAPRTITVIPDTAAKRREYEEAVVHTFYLSNADIKEVIDLLRVVIDIRQISPITATNAVSLKDTPERIAAAGRLIAAIDKARPEVVIDVELLEVDRTKLHEYGLQIASPGSAGISGTIDANRDDMTLRSLRSLTQSDVFLSGLPALVYRLLKTDSSTRTLASPQIRTSEGVTAQARFGEQVPIPSVTFAPIATGGVNQQPITSFAYQNIGVNIDITPRTHHDDAVTLALKLSLTSQVGVGFGELPVFGNREINTTIRLRDGETNVLAGLIRDDERTVLAGTPGLVDLPIIGRLFARNEKEVRQTDIILTLTPHIVRVLDLTEEDLRPFRMSRDSGSVGTGGDRETITLPPRGGGEDQVQPLPTAPPRDPRQPETPAQPPTQPFPGPGTQPLGTLPGTPVTPPTTKKPGGGRGGGSQP